MSHDGEIVLHRTMQAAPAPFLQAVAPSRNGLVGAVEGRFPWDWRADLCAAQGMPCGLGPALSLKASHGGTATNDTMASQQMAARLRGGLRPKASGSPAALRATRDLVRRRTPLRRTRADLVAHGHKTKSPYPLPELGKKLA